MTRMRTDGPVIGRRILAYTLDAAAIVGSIAAVRRRGERSEGPSVGATLAMSGLVAIPYHVILEGMTGKTIGKQLCGIVVVRSNGEPCTFTASTIRTVLRFVDWLPAGYAAGLASMAITERHQRIGDLVSDTVVVRVDDRGGGRAGGSKSENSEAGSNTDCPR